MNIYACSTHLFQYVEVAQYHFNKNSFNYLLQVDFFLFVIFHVEVQIYNRFVHGNHLWHLVHKKLFWLQIISRCEFKTKGIDPTVLVNECSSIVILCYGSLAVIENWKILMSLLRDRSFLKNFKFFRQILRFSWTSLVFPINEHSLLLSNFTFQMWNKV